MKNPIISLLKLYQKTISPDHGFLSGGKRHVCRFEPTCSQYTIEAIARYGTIRGVGKGSYRILRCNPWSKGGYDPVK